MALRKVNTGGDRVTYKAVELPRFGIVIREELAEKAEKELEQFEAFSATGVLKRVDLTRPERREEAWKIIDWVWNKGLTLTNNIVAKGTTSLQMVVGPVLYYQTNLDRDEWKGGPGVCAADPEFQALRGKLPDAVIEPDMTIIWSGDINFPYNFAHFTDGEIAIKAMQICARRGWVYPIYSGNIFWGHCKGIGRLGTLGIGGECPNDTLLPGQHIMDKHKIYYEKGHWVRSLFTGKEEAYLQKMGWNDVQKSAAEQAGLNMDQFYADLVKGAHDGELLKPGVKVEFSASVPYMGTLRKQMSFWRDKAPMSDPDWWKERNHVDNQGVIQNFGEFEEQEFRELIDRLGYTEVDEKGLYKGKFPEGLSRKCEIPDALLKA